MSRINSHERKKRFFNTFRAEKIFTIKNLMARSFVAQTIVLVLLALIVAQALSLFILGTAYRSAVSDVNQSTRVQQIISLVQLLESSPPEQYSTILAASRNRYGWYSVSYENKTPGHNFNRAEKIVAGDVERGLGARFRGRVRVNIKSEYLDRSFDLDNCPDCLKPGKYARHHAPDIEYRQREAFARTSKIISLQISVQMGNGLWLNLRASAPKPPKLALRHILLFMGISMLLVIVVLMIMMRRITQPLKRLTSAAHRLGIGEQVEPLSEEGPKDIRETIRSFNQMNNRLQRFVSDRTRMLAALSHDLRTPITTLRLRVELMPDSQDRDQLLSTLNEMQQMSEATLAFMRQASDAEETRKVELNAMLYSLCEDYLELGQDVQYSEAEETIISCRPVSMKRALRNLIDNAVKYGDQARVSLKTREDKVNIVVEDKGPGIPEYQMNKVFEPFFRLEESRNRDTGGIGLGMAIARNIIRNHGGDIQLENTAGGLKVTISL